MEKENKKVVEKVELTDKERIKMAEDLNEKATALGLNMKVDKRSFSGTFYNKDSGEKELSFAIDKYGEYTIAGVVPDNQLNGYDYLSEAKDYETDTVKRTELIKLSRKAVRFEGIIGTALEALIEIPTLGGWYIDNVKDPELKKLLKYWLNNYGSIGSDEFSYSDDSVKPVLGCEDFALNVLWDLYVDGDCVITEVWDKAKFPATGKSVTLPVRYISHDVSALTIDEAASRMGVERIVAEIDDDILDAAKGGDTDKDPEKEFLQKNIPDEIKEIIKENADEYVLPPILTTHFSRKSNNRTSWGMPYIVRCFPALAYKHRLRALDNATIDGLIQRVWIIKIGDKNPESEWHVPDDDRVLLAVSAFKRLKAQNFLVWPGSDLEKEELGSSENNVLSFQDRYKSADDDIRIALGVPRVLLDGGNAGTGGTGANKEWSAFAKTLSQMERYQMMIKRYFDRKLRQICIENKYKDEFPRFNWQYLKMQDREKAKNVATKLFEDNAIGFYRVHYMTGNDPDIILEEMQHEKDSRLWDSIPINQTPLTKQDPGRPEDSKDGDGDDNSKTKPSNPDSNRDGKGK